MSNNENGHKKGQNKQRRNDVSANSAEMKYEKGEIFLNNTLETQKACISQMVNVKSDFDQNKIFTKFLADSGATEHLTNSKIIFKSFDNKNCGRIRCANKKFVGRLRNGGSGYNRSFVRRK